MASPRTWLTIRDSETQRGLAARASTMCNVSSPMGKKKSASDPAIPERARIKNRPLHAAPRVAAMLTAPQGSRTRPHGSHPGARSTDSAHNPAWVPHSIHDALPGPLPCRGRLTVPEAFMAFSPRSPPPTKGSVYSRTAAHHDFVTGSPALSKPRVHWLLGPALNQICFFIGSRYTNLFTAPSSLATRLQLPRGNAASPSCSAAAVRLHRRAQHAGSGRHLERSLRRVLAFSFPLPPRDPQLKY